MPLVKFQEIEANYNSRKTGGKRKDRSFDLSPKFLLTVFRTPRGVGGNKAPSDEEEEEEDGLQIGMAEHVIAGFSFSELVLRFGLLQRGIGCSISLKPR